MLITRYVDGKNVAGDMYQLNVFNTKLTQTQVVELNMGGRCNEFSNALQSQITISWEKILTQGETKGEVTKMDLRCPCPAGRFKIW